MSYLVTLRRRIWWRCGRRNWCRCRRIWCRCRLDWCCSCCRSWGFGIKINCSYYFQFFSCLFGFDWLMQFELCFVRWLCVRIIGICGMYLPRRPWFDLITATGRYWLWFNSIDRLIKLFWCLLSERSSMVLVAVSLNRMSFSDCPFSIQLSRSSARSFYTVLVIVHLAQASCPALCLVSGLPYKLMVLWESSVVTGQR